MDITWSIFPKFFQSLGLAELAETIKRVGLDTTNLVIRKGYWVEPDNLAETVPVFVKAMDQAGLTVQFATAGFMLKDLAEDDSPLAILADNGVTDFRMGYFGWDRDKFPTPAEAFADARRQMEQLARLCEKHGVRAVYQVHHGSLIIDSWTAWRLVSGLPSEHVGVMLDPGNQVHEGFEDWGKAVPLLGDHLTAVGVKDVAYFRDQDREEWHKGWRKEWVPTGEGVIDWYKLARALKAGDFKGTFVYMPFYNNSDPAVQADRLVGDVSYLRKVFAEVRAETEGE